MEVGVSDGKIRIKRQLALRIDVAGDQEIQSDWRIRIGAWLGLLGFDICDPDRQCDCSKRAPTREADQARTCVRRIGVWVNVNAR